jgi:hypothetical protein
MALTVQTAGIHRCDATFILGRETANRVLGAACLAAPQTPRPSIMAHEDRRVTVDRTISRQHGVENDHEEEAQRLPDACDGLGAVLRFRLHA